MMVGIILNITIYVNHNVVIKLLLDMKNAMTEITYLMMDALNANINAIKTAMFASSVNVWNVLIILN